MNINLQAMHMRSYWVVVLTWDLAMQCGI